MKNTIILLMLLSIISCATVSLAEEPRLEAKLELETVSPGNPLYMYVTFFGSHNLEPWEIEPVNGLQIKYRGASSKIGVVNGKVSKSVTMTYLIIPLKTGVFDIGPFSVDYNGRKYYSKPLVLTVTDFPSPGKATRSSSVGGVPTGTAPRSTAAQSRSKGEPYSSDKIFLTMNVDKRMLYANEEATLTVKVYVTDMGLKDIEYPVFEHEGFSAGKNEEPKKGQETVRGKRFDTLTFRQKLFALKEGDFILGPAKLRCKLLVAKQTSRRRSLFGRSVFNDEFFSGMMGYTAYPVELESEGIPVSILPFPKEGRPEGFEGAVGHFDLDISVDPLKVKVGDPVILKMTVSGRGNLDTVTSPHLAYTDKFKTYEPQINKESIKKIYEQVLIPKTDDITETPEVSFSFFDPDIEEYKTFRRGPVLIEVIKQPKDEKTVKMVSMPGVQSVIYPEEKIGKDIVYIKEEIGKSVRKGEVTYGNPLFWFFHVVPLVLGVFFFIRYKEKEKLISDKTYARFQHAPREARRGLAEANKQLEHGDISAFYDSIFRVLQEYLSGKLDLPRGTLSVAKVDARIKSFSGAGEITGHIDDIFKECEIARYTSYEPDVGKARQALDKVKHIIGSLEKIRR